jgi:hypothetical protein
MNSITMDSVSVPKTTIECMMAYVDLVHLEHNIIKKLRYALLSVKVELYILNLRMPVDAHLIHITFLMFV